MLNTKLILQIPVQVILDCDLYCIIGVYEYIVLYVRFVRSPQVYTSLTQPGYIFFYYQDNKSPDLNICSFSNTVGHHSFSNTQRVL